MISHKHRCVFVHIPKCAGQSVETAFLDDLGLDWDSRDRLLLRENTDPSQGPPRLAHLTATDYVACGHISAHEFAEYFSFAVVRNPWARAVSFYRYLDFNESFPAFINRRVSSSLRNKNSEFWFLRPQVDFLVDNERRVILNRILAFESLDSEFESLAASIGLGTSLRHINQSTPGQARKEAGGVPTARESALRGARSKVSRAARHLKVDRRSSSRVWEDFYDDSTWSRVADLYAEDIEALGYADETRPVRSD